MHDIEGEWKEGMLSNKWKYLTEIRKRRGESVGRNTENYEEAERARKIQRYIETDIQTCMNGDQKQKTLNTRVNSFDQLLLPIHLLLAFIPIRYSTILPLSLRC